MVANITTVKNYLAALERNYQLMQETEEKCLAQGSTVPEGTCTAWNLEQKLDRMLGIHSEVRPQFESLQEEYKLIRRYIGESFT